MRTDLKAACGLSMPRSMNLPLRCHPLLLGIGHLCRNNEVYETVQSTVLVGFTVALKFRTLFSLPSTFVVRTINDCEHFM